MGAVNGGELIGIGGTNTVTGHRARQDAMCCICKQGD